MRSQVVNKMGQYEVIVTLKHPKSPLIIEVIKADGTVDVNGQTFPQRRWAYAFKLGGNKARMTYFGFDYKEDMEFLVSEAERWIAENNDSTPRSE